MPLVEHNTVIRNLHLVTYIDKTKDVQNLFTKFFPGLYDTSYAIILISLKLESLEVRRLTADHVFLFKMVQGFGQIDCLEYLSFDNAKTRGHNLKFLHQYIKVNTR